MNNNPKTCVIVPAIVVHNLDPHTGIPFLPHMAGYMASALNKFGYDVEVFDCFGIEPNNRRKFDDFMVLGIDEDWVANEIDASTNIVFIYCRTVEDLFSVEKIIKSIKKHRNDIKICLFENIQTTNSFSLLKIIDYLFDQGIDVAIMGEPERRAHDIVQGLIGNSDLSKVPGIAYRKNEEICINESESFDNKLDELAFPLWEKFQMEGYWKAGFAHAPIKKNAKFLPIISSRGCPYRCTFCVSPTLNPNWRKRSAKNVVDEMEKFYNELGVTDFHFSDLDPTVDDKRTKEICKEIIKRELKIEWKLSQGTKIETIKNVETLELLKTAGLTFFSFSPESGSAELMKKLNKPFDYEHALFVTKNLNRLNIKSQACFIAGTPDETKSDQIQSIDYVKKLVKAGVDEIGVFIYSPIPGSALADRVKGFSHFSELTRSPTWREDYKNINKYRMKMYRTFLIYKILFFPNKVIKECLRIISKNFHTKMEMSIYKWLKLRLLYFVPGIYKKSSKVKLNA